MASVCRWEFSFDHERRHEMSYPIDMGGIRINILVVIGNLLQKEAVGLLYHCREGLRSRMLLQKTQLCRCGGNVNSIQIRKKLLIISPLGLLLKVFNRFVA